MYNFLTIKMLWGKKNKDYMIKNKVLEKKVEWQLCCICQSWLKELLQLEAR